MSLRQWFGQPRSVLVLFLGTMLVLGGALAWLSWQLLAQDRALERQRIQERLEQAIDRAVSELQRTFADFDALLGVDPAGPNLELPDGVAVLLMTEHELSMHPPGSILFQPVTPAEREPPPGTFEQGEALEHRLNDLAAAAVAYRAQSLSHDPFVRAGALLRLGRVLRKSGKHEEALRAYDELAQVGTVRFADLPAELVAREARCAVLEAASRNAELREEAERMRSALLEGRWTLLRPSWEYYLEEARRRTDGRGRTEPESQAVALSRAVEWLHARWVAETETRGHMALRFEEGPVLARWSGAAGGLRAVLAGPGYVASLWNGLERRLGVRAALLDGEGSILIGEPGSAGQHVVRPAAIAGHSWMLRLAEADSAAESAASSSRRRLLFGGFGVLALVLFSGSYFILRSIGRELAVARLQSEFVSAVSHEFRTPLTSLRQLSEMLEKGRIERDAQKQQSYSILVRESERLQRLVESLLDFGRMESGAFRYRFREVDPSALVTEVVSEFRGEAAARGFEIDMEDPGGLPRISADPEALGLALWNLLDNAVKYSPECRTVWVETTRNGDRVAIRVRDRGQGIPPSEQKKIFGKFVRGEAARSGSIKGTGIGLALVRHIVEAHRGEIRVASTPGEGSTFAILLPTEKIT